MARRFRAPATCAAGLLVLALLVQNAMVPRPTVLGYDRYTVIALPFLSPTAPANPRLEDAILNWLNGARAAQQLPPLVADPAIRNVARNYGHDMFAHGYLSHVSLDGRTLLDRLAAAGLQPQLAGENLAYARTLSEAEGALWRSEPHRRNILYPAYRTVGVGVLDGGAKGVVVVQDFSDNSAAIDEGTPAQPTVRFQTAPAPSHMVMDNGHD